MNYCVKIKGFGMVLKAKFKYIAFLLCAVFILSGCGSATEGNGGSKDGGSLLQQEVFAPVRYESGAGKVRISEVMARNCATLQDADGDFSDWIEIENICGEDINLQGWTISDDELSEGWCFPGFILYADSRAIVFASKKDRADTELHTNFSISKGETVFLKDRNSDTVSSVPIDSEKRDCSLAADSENVFSLCLYPTPGRENTGTAYDQLQDARNTDSPLVIYEVSVDNRTYFPNDKFGYSDWLELKNMSSEPLDISEYYISDDENDMLKFRLPAETLNPGEIKLLLCDKKADKYTGSRTMANFSLDAENERLYLSDGTGALKDYISLKNIPYGCTYGRADGKNGFFYFCEPSPEKNNREGFRRVSGQPVALTADGIFNGTDSVKLELKAEGRIYYTDDGSLPTKNSTEYTEPIKITESGIIRAVAVEDGQLESRAITCNYILNQEHDLPVVCLVSDSKKQFVEIYENKETGVEIPGNISYYDNGGSFSINCGIKMHGFSTLELAKKNMSVRFRGSYGESKLNYDLFDGGVTEFTNLLLRGGGDQTYSIVRNEACMNVAMQFSDAFIGQRNKYCVLYVNGEYRGIYALMEKTNEQLYASIAGVSESSVVMNEATVDSDDEMYEDIIDFILMEDMSVPENYQKVCDAIDIDSLVDWCVFEGWTGNNDLTSGNMRYVKSTENDGKWRLMLYDLDAAFYSSANCMVNVFDFWNQITMMNSSLLKNDEYKDKVLRRSAEALSTVLTEENISAEYTRLCEQIDSEVERDSTVSGLSYSNWRAHVNTQQELFKTHWNRDCIYNLCYLLRVSDEQRAQYFGD